jgi:hypothetical protein
MELLCLPDVLPGSRYASCSNSSGFESCDICTYVYVFVESPLRNSQGYYSVSLTFRRVSYSLVQPVMLFALSESTVWREWLHL